MVAADGDIAMVHGRCVGWAPKPVVGVDIFRVSEGKVAEHWDVLQEEAPVELTKSERPMFTKSLSGIGLAIALSVLHAEVHHLANRQLMRLNRAHR